MPEVTATQMLLAAQNGDTVAIERLFPLVYSELRTIAHRHLTANTLANHVSPTDLVHEAYLKLVDQRQVSWKSRTHFFAIGSRVMRQLLVDRARIQMSAKRGAGNRPLALNEELLTRTDDRHVLAIEETLQRLEEISLEQARIVEMRFFAGMTVEEVAHELGRSKRWVEAEWTMIRAWLRAELSED